jgi:sialate O-acetylesterase
MITHWRAHFGQGDLPFLWVQLANFKAPKDSTRSTWAYLREAQTKTLALPATGQAITIDIGDPNDIHPLNKQEVGRRLALLARAKVYGAPVDCSGPEFLKAEREATSLRLHFANAGSGLTAADQPLAGFEIAGADQKFYPATARIDRETVLVSATEVPEPVTVRYAWSNAPAANLYNGAGLPAAPFRTDNW